MNELVALLGIGGGAGRDLLKNLVPQARQPAAKQGSLGIVLFGIPGFVVALYAVDVGKGDVLVVVAVPLDLVEGAGLDCVVDALGFAVLAFECVCRWATGL